jgi:hypothetical protein
VFVAWHHLVNQLKASKIDKETEARALKLFDTAWPFASAILRATPKCPQQRLTRAQDDDWSGKLQLLVYECGHEWDRISKYYISTSYTVSRSNSRSSNALKNPKVLAMMNEIRLRHGYTGTKS